MSSGLVSDNIMRWIRSIASPALGTDAQGASELALDAATDTLKFGTKGNTTKEILDLSTTQTVTGNKTFSGSTAISGALTLTGAVAGVRDSVSVTLADTVAITTAQSGTVFICTKTSATQVLTLPAAATAGLCYTFVCGAGAAGGEIQVAVGTGDNIVGKTHAANDGTGLVSTVTTGLLKNTAATNVVADMITLVSDGITTWYSIAQTGVWSVT